MSLDRRGVLNLGGGAVASLSLAAGPAARAAPARSTARARRPLLIDTLGGIADPNLDVPDTSPAGINARALADGRASGLTAFNQTIGYVSGPEDPYAASLASIAQWDAFIAAHGQDLLKVLSVADIRNARSSGRMGVILGFQNGAMFGLDPTRAADFAKRGLRIIQLTYNPANQLGDGSMAPENRGLTPLGREVVGALNQARILVDLSHSGENTCLDAIAASRAPIIISHTGCRALADLPRNKTDRELRLAAEGGGVVGIYFMPFLAIDRQPTPDDLVAHIEHAVHVCGEDHVSIGTDGTVPRIDDMAKYREALKVEVATRKATGIGAAGERADIVPFIPELQGPDKFWLLADRLAARGHSEARIDKLLGKNFLRLAGEVW